MFGVKVNTEASSVEGDATGVFRGGQGRGGSSLLGFLRRKEAGLKV